MARSRRGGAAALPQEALDPGVFERMEGHHGEPAARHQHPLGRGQTAIQFAQFVVDRDAQRLKRAGGGIEPGLAGRDRRAHDRRQFAGAADRAALPSGDNRPGDTPGEALLAERADELGQRILRELRDEIGGIGPGIAHAHVERAIEAERKPPFGAIELYR